VARNNRIGDLIHTRTITMQCICVEVPRKGNPLNVYFPLQQGGIYGPVVDLDCKPGMVILGEAKDPFGVIEEYVRLYLEWLYFKSDE
jgi:hypothetical protein